MTPKYEDENKKLKAAAKHWSEDPSAHLAEEEQPFQMPEPPPMVAPNGGAYVGMENRAPASAAGKRVYHHYADDENDFYAGYKYGFIPNPRKAAQRAQQQQSMASLGQPAQPQQYAPPMAADPGYPDPMAEEPSTGEDMPQDAAPDDGDTTYGDLDVSRSQSGQGAWFGNMPRVPAGPAGTVAIMAPNGKVKHIPKDQAQAAIAAGGKLVG